MSQLMLLKYLEIYFLKIADPGKIFLKILGKQSKKTYF